MKRLKTLTFVQRDAVGIVTIDRPDALNAIDVLMSRESLEVAIACERDDDIRVVLLRSEGKMFCPGGDIAAFAQAGDGAGQLILEEATYLHAAVSRLVHMNKPIVVAVQGMAAGAGVSLAMLGDIVVAARSAKFTLAYTAIGLSPDGGISWMLPRLVGLRKAQHLLLTNARLSAEEAHGIGMVTETVEDADLAHRAMAVARRLATGPTRAFGRCRELLLGAYAETLEAHLEREARGIVASITGPEGTEGIAAFVQKRAPVFVPPSPA